MYGTVVISYITGYLGLSNTYIRLQQALNEDSKVIILEIIERLDGHADDPYHGLKH